MLDTLISHYRIIALLGEGGMGAVYRAEDTRLGRFVALKVLSEDALREGGGDRFLIEARAAAQISHPNVCTIHDILESDAGRFIVMELVEGMTLRQRIAEAAGRGELLPVTEVVAYALQIARALQAAHARGIVHRDIKSDNIMIDAAGRIRVMDFGLATLAASERGAIAPSAAGTLGYMPPELLRGEESDARGDIFSFGVLLHEALTGRLPFRGVHRAAMIYSVLNEEPQAVSSIRSDLPDRLSSIIARALARDPASRFASIDDMLAELSLLSTSEAVAAADAAPVTSPPGNVEPVSGSSGEAGPVPDGTTARSELRLYISSSFGDLDDERAHLAGKIFPEIRALCRQRGIGFTEIDLRWGLAEEELQGEAIRTSLQEIDRCRPYFIGIAGDRYGRALELHRIYQDPELIARHPWIEDAAIEGASLLEIEFRHGALDDPGSAAAGAAFYFRRRHPDDGEEESKRLDALQKEVERSGLPVERFREPVALGELVYERLLEIIERDFPAEEALSELDRERLRHEVFAASRRQAYIPSPRYLKALNEFVESPSAPAAPLVVEGESGLGKSALLAFWCRHYRRRHPEIFLVEHHVGIGSGGSDHLGVMRHLVLEIRERLSLSRELPKSNDLESAFASWLAEVRSEPMVIVLDGLDQLEPAARALSWLPAFIPPNIRVIVSTISDRVLPGATDPEWARLRLEPLSEREREAMIVRFLSECHRSIPQEMVGTIARDPKSAQPLFLRTIMEEIRLVPRQDGIESMLGELLQTRDTEELFQRVLERLEREFTVATVGTVLSLIWGSRSGLTEMEIAALARISRLKLSSLRIALDYHLIRTDERLRFFHDYLRRAVESRYLAVEEDRRAIHIRIADYLEIALTDAGRRNATPRAGTPEYSLAEGRELRRIASDLLWHLERAGERERLRATLSRPLVVNAMALRDQPYELLGYWLAAGGVEEMERAYNGLIGSLEQSGIDPREQIQIVQHVAHFYRMAGLARSGIDLARLAVALHRSIHGEDSQLTWESVSNLAILLRGAEAYEEAEALYRDLLPVQEQKLGGEHREIAQTLNNLAVVLLYRRKVVEAEEYLRRSLAIRERVLGPNDPMVASSYANLAGILLNRGEYIEAIGILRRALAIVAATQGTEHPVYAKALSNLGSILFDMHDWEEAEQMIRGTLAIREARLGARHPETAHALNNLALVLRDTGRIAEAEEVIGRAVAIRREALGERSQETLQSMNNLATILLKKGEITEGVELFRQVLEKREAMNGPDHVMNAYPLIGLGEGALAIGELEEAEQYLARALRIREESLGESHPEVATILAIIARVAHAGGEHARADEAIARAIAIRTRAFGAEAPATRELM
jgi:serine/threonine protein kinase/tetratricopeptide (TPR) repeat protein